MAESFYGGRAGHDFTIYHCYSPKKDESGKITMTAKDVMIADFKELNSHTPIGGYCLTSDGELYRRMINNEALSLGNIAVMGMEDLENTFLYRDGANIKLPEITKTDVPTKILTMENNGNTEKFAYCGITGDNTNISVSIEDKKIKINHNSKSFTPTNQSRPLRYGGQFSVPDLAYDEQGHIKGKLTTTYTLPAAISYSAGTGISLNNNTISLNAATDNSLGGIKTGYTESEKNYAVKLDSNKKAYVTVPWANSGGTVTSVSVKVNGSVKGTVTSSGEIDLGTLATTDTTYSAGGGLTLSGNTFSLGGSNNVTLPLTLKGAIQVGEWIKLNDSMTKIPRLVGSSYCIEWTLTEKFSLPAQGKLRLSSSDKSGFLDGNWDKSIKDDSTPFLLLRTGENLAMARPSSGGAGAKGNGWYFTDFVKDGICYTTLELTPNQELTDITSMSLILPTNNTHVNTNLQTKSNAYFKGTSGTQTVTLLKIDEYGKITFYDYDS